MTRGLNCATIGIVFVIRRGAAVDIDPPDYIALEICDVIIDRIIILDFLPSLPVSRQGGNSKHIYLRSI